ncbi:glycosyltransferase family 2 protein [Chryseobacterium sp. CT-SW4]|uniref:glycosyltransferase family 2 protein n=1 Tax=Chryseobacterium sp. SW-1 TaxID=3157343 RepID=UPI003B023434
MTPPKLSIIIANYNNGQYFQDCYDSLVKQTSDDWEAIIIDDGSTDDSVEVIKKIIAGNPHFRFFENENNMGYQKTLIRGIEISETPIFCRLDPDDLLREDAVEKSLEYHEKYPEVGLVYSNMYFCDNDLKVYDTHKAKQITELNYDYYNFHGEITQLATFKRSIYNLTSGIDSFIKRAEDKDIYMKMCEIAPVKHLDEELYYYRRIQGSLSWVYYKAFFWHWVALIKMAERRNINLEDLFYEKMRNVFVIPKTQPFEKSIAFKFFRLEQKVKKLFKK